MCSYDLLESWGLHTGLITEAGRGVVQTEQQQLRLHLPPVSHEKYHNAQITSYSPDAYNFNFVPPLRMTVHAYTSSDGDKLRGTAGFGFWNHPFEPNRRGFRLPQALWFFFASPPSNMKLAIDVPSHGWKAATINARRWQFLALLPTAPFGFLLTRIPGLYHPLWRVGQNALGVSEALLDSHLLAESHTYSLEWQKDRVTFTVDDKAVLQSPNSIHHPLGFIAWMDNQYAVATPQGSFRFGLVNVPQEQSLWIESICIEKL